MNILILNSKDYQPFLHDIHSDCRLKCHRLPTEYCFAVLCLALFFLVAPICAQSNKKSFQGHVVTYPQDTPIKQGSFIIEFSNNHENDLSSAATVSDTLLRTSGITIVSHYTGVFNGMLIKTNDNAAATTISKFRNVKRIWPVRYHKLQYMRSSFNSSSFPTLFYNTGVSRTIMELGVNGTGVKIGIVDSGVDYTHPELGNCWKTKGCPWQHGADFIGDRYNASSPSPIIDPNPTPMDCDGHGTHVSGIVAAQGPLVHGVAPGATFGMYRVFSCPIDGNVYSSDDIILEGIEAAYRDGHTVISLSLGGGTWPEDPLAVACSTLATKGVVVVAADGNDGSSGLFTSGSPAIGRGVISVGSVDNWNITGRTAMFSTPDGVKTILLSSPGSELHPFVYEASVSVVAPIDGLDSIEGCSIFYSNLTGKVALVKRGTCTFSEKAIYAQKAGAIGIVVYNNAAGMMTPGVNSSVLIPTVIISRSDGMELERDILRNEITVVAKEASFGTYPADTEGMISSFSSLGPTPELGIAPIISAPGGNIWSTYPLNLGGYATLSGTSMATPFVAGVVALVKQARPELNSQQIYDILVESAQPLQSTTTKNVIHPYQGGAGLVNAYRATTTRASFTPSTISINSSEWNAGINNKSNSTDRFPEWRTFKIDVSNLDSTHGMTVWLERSGISDQLSMYASNGSLADTVRTKSPDSTVLNVYPHIISNLHSSVVATAVYVKPAMTSSLFVNISIPIDLERKEAWYYGGVLNFTIQWESSKNNISYFIPYAGYSGDFRMADVLAPLSSGLPVITDSQNQPLNDLEHFTASKDKIGLLTYSLVIPSKVVTATLIDYQNKTLGYLPYGYIEYAARNLLDSNPLNVAVINGTIFSDKKGSDPITVLPGQYHVCLAALRPLGDPENDSDYQIWNSASFSIE